MPDAPVSAVIVGFEEDPSVILRAIRGLKAQTTPPQEIIFVDNHPDAIISRAIVTAEPDTRMVRSGADIGYSSACNLAVPLARGRHVFFLNPDADAEPDCLERLVAEIEADERTAIVGAQILLPDGQTTNAGDNPLHLSGLSWAGRWGLPREDGPPRDVLVASGAAMLVRRGTFLRLGGFAEGFFLYYDDADLGWRANLAGCRVRFVPQARVRHDYEFEKGGYKWRLLERNRWYALLANYQVRTLALLLPLLLAVEAAVWVLALRRGFAREKARSWLSLLRALPGLRAWRRTVQALRVVPDRDLVSRFAAEVDSPILDSPLVRRAGPWLLRYRRLLVVLLGGASRSPSRT